MDVPLGFQSVYATGKNAADNNHECQVSKINGQKYSITDCEKDAPVQVVLMKLTQADSPNGNMLGGGGLAAFELTCNSGDGIKNGNNNFTVSRYASSAQLQKPIVDKENKENEIIGLSMHIKKTTQSQQDIYIGDTLYILIVVPKGPNYGVSECIASSKLDSQIKMPLITAGHIDTKATNLLESPGFVVDQGNGPSKCDVLSQIFDKQTSTCIAATMYAFHFKTDTNVNINCTINVCGKNSNNSICTSRRRRSEPDDTSRTGVTILSKTITVYELLRVDTPDATAGSAKSILTFAMMMVLSGFAWISNGGYYDI